MVDLAESVFNAVKGYVDRELGKLATKFNADLLSIARQPGPPGEEGEPGLPGDKGDKGDRGEPGERGEKGDAGVSVTEADKTGLKNEMRSFAAELVSAIPTPLNGERGEKGERGEPGIGIKGDAGERGEKGEPGLSAKGEKGEPGDRGEKGEPGLSVKGDKGDRGEKGEPGLSVKGEKGDPGVKGDAGIGVKGDKGDKGDPGESIKGDRGDPGASAFQIAKAGGFIGSEAEWLLTLRAEDGARGEPGRPGRDALQIDLCAGIDPDRSYPARTFAAFNGGTFYAVRETDPLRGVDRPALAGWHVTQNGIQSDVETLEDGGRWRVRTLTLADGTVSVQKQKTKMQIYRGVHQRGRAYDEGDAVTDFGCQWTALEDTKERPKARDPSGPQAWALTVKNGKDAREIREPREHDNRTPLQ